MRRQSDMDSFMLGSRECVFRCSLSEHDSKSFLQQVTDDRGHNWKARPVEGPGPPPLNAFAQMKREQLKKKAKQWTSVCVLVVIIPVWSWWLLCMQLFTVMVNNSQAIFTSLAHLLFSRKMLSTQNLVLEELLSPNGLRTCRCCIDIYPLMCNHCALT